MRFPFFGPPSGKSSPAGGPPRTPEVPDDADRALRALRSEEGARRERIGRRGERAAAEALRAAGYRIVAKNVRTPAGEIDVVAIDGQTIALVEVKATAGPGAASPARRVDHAKRGRLRLAWKAIARNAGWSAMPYRFDVVAVRFDASDGKGSSPECRVVRGAFRMRP